MSARFSATALVVPFENLRMTDVEVVGGKNASLGEMISQLPHGVRVPGGFATTAHAFREFLKHGGLDRRIQERLATLDTEDVRALAAAGAEIRGWVESQPFPPELEAAIQESAGHPFKVNSTPQLRTVLFDELGLAPQKKTKTGFSTDAASLEKLAGQHPDYLYVALKAYQTDKNPKVGRSNPIMATQAKLFTHAELKTLATYAASLPSELKTVPQSKVHHQH